MQYRSTHCGFGDESHWQKGRYRTVGLVTLPATQVADVTSGVLTIAERHSIREFKWHKVSSAKHRFAMNEICTLVANREWRGKLRIDILIWDVQDTRHRVPHRDDTANLARMYYHLMRNVVERRWPDATGWLMSLDERTDMDWGTLEDCLRGRSRKEKMANEPPLVSLRGTARQRPPRVRQVRSPDEPLVQLADLFAGLGAFSWNMREEHHAWQAVQTERDRGQLSLDFGLQGAEVSNSARFKHEVLSHFTGIRTPGVVLKKDEGLRTYGPKNSINFWLYEPHRASDKAPQRLIA